MSSDEDSDDERDSSVHVIVSNLAGPQLNRKTFSQYCESEVIDYSVELHVDDHGDPLEVQEPDRLKFTVILTFERHESAKHAVKKLRQVVRYARDDSNFSQFLSADARLYSWKRREGHTLLCQKHESAFREYTARVLGTGKLPEHIDFGAYPTYYSHCMCLEKRGWKGLSADQVNRLIDKLKCSAHVKKIIMSRNILDGTQWHHFADALKRHSSLTHLGLHQLNLSEREPDAPRDLVRALKNLTALQHLDIGENNFSEQGCVELGAVLKGLTALQHINAYGWIIGEKGCASLVEGITGHPSLQRINFNCLRGFCDAGFDRLANALSTLPQLHRVAHSYFRAGYPGQVQLAGVRFRGMNFRIVGFHHYDIFHRGHRPDGFIAELVDGPCPLQKCLENYFRHLLNTHSSFRALPPPNWYVQQVGSNQSFFSNHPPLCSAPIDIPATVARQKPTYLVQHENGRPVQKILIAMDFTVLIPLRRFFARTLQFLSRFRSAFEGRKPFRVFIPVMSLARNPGDLTAAEMFSILGEELPKRPALESTSVLCNRSFRWNITGQNSQHWIVDFGARCVRQIENVDASSHCTYTVTECNFIHMMLNGYHGFRKVPEMIEKQKEPVSFDLITTMQEVGQFHKLRPRNTELREIFNFEDFLSWLAHMVPLTDKDLWPLLASAKLPTDLVLIVDHSENVLRSFDSFMLNHSPGPTFANAAVTLSEVDLKNISDGRFWFHDTHFIYRENERPHADHFTAESLLQRYCLENPAISVAVDLSKLTSPEQILELKRKRCVVWQVNSYEPCSFLRLFKSFMTNSSIEHLEIRSPLTPPYEDSIEILLHGLDLPAPFTTLKSVIFPKQLFTQIRGELKWPIDGHSEPRCITLNLCSLDFQQSVFVKDDPHSCSSVKSISMEGTHHLDLVRIAQLCPDVEHFCFHEQFGDDIARFRDVPQFHHVRSIEFRFFSSMENDNLRVAIPKLLIGMGYVQSLIFSSDKPGVFAFSFDSFNDGDGIDVELYRQARAGIQFLFLDFPCTANHKYLFEIAFPSALIVCLKPTIEPSSFGDFGGLGPDDEEWPKNRKLRVARLRLVTGGRRLNDDEVMSIAACAAIQIDICTDYHIDDCDSGCWRKCAFLGAVSCFLRDFSSQFRSDFWSARHIVFRNSMYDCSVFRWDYVADSYLNNAPEILNFETQVLNEIRMKLKSLLIYKEIKNRYRLPDVYTTSSSACRPKDTAKTSSSFDRQPRDPNRKPLKIPIRSGSAPDHSIDSCNSGSSDEIWENRDTSERHEPMIDFTSARTVASDMNTEGRRGGKPPTLYARMLFPGLHPSNYRLDVHNRVSWERFGPHFSKDETFTPLSLHEHCSVDESAFRHQLSITMTMPTIVPQVWIGKKLSIPLQFLPPYPPLERNRFQVYKVNGSAATFSAKSNVADIVPFIVQRPDSDPSSSTYGEWFMKLRRRPDASKGADVWAEGMVSEGDKVTVVRMNAPDETGFAWVRTSSDAEGFLRSEFLAVAPRAQPTVRNPEVQFQMVEYPSISPAEMPFLPPDIVNAMDKLDVMSVLCVDRMDSDQSKLLKICRYCKSFTEKELPPLNLSLADKVISEIVDIGHRYSFRVFFQLFLSQAGVCRHRSQVATILCHYFGIPAMYVTNDIHAYIEVVVENRLRAIDLGGGSARLKFVNPQSGKRLVAKPKFVHVNDAIPSLETVADLKTVTEMQLEALLLVCEGETAKATKKQKKKATVESLDESKTTPLQQVETVEQSETVEEIARRIRKKQKADQLEIKKRADQICEILKTNQIDNLSQIIPALELGQSYLLQVQNCSSACRNLLNELKRNDLTSSWNIEHAQSLDALQHFRDLIEFCDGDFTFKTYDGLACVVIDYSQIPATHLADVQTSIDAELSQGKKTCVVGIIDEAFASKRSEDFFSRWQKNSILKSPNSPSQDTLLYAIPSTPSPASCIDIDLRSSLQWSSILLGGVRRISDGSDWTIEDGKLQRFLEQPHGDLHLRVLNPPLSLPAFSLAWESLLRNRGLRHLGRELKIPCNFSWSFATTNVPFRVLPIYDKSPGKMVWFVTKETVAFLDSFPYLSMDGKFCQHDGYLADMKTDHTVVLSSELSSHEFAYIHDKIKARDVKHIFASGLSEGSVWSPKVLGRGIYFSLNERVTQSLIKQSRGGLAFMETNWLRDLESPKNVFTLVFPEHHPDIAHVKNWIRFRQIWFPHRSVHVQATLHIMQAQTCTNARASAVIDAFESTSLKQLDAMLRKHRLVQLSGPPGCGKTTLASRFHRHAEAKRQGGLVADTPKSDQTPSDEQDKSHGSLSATSSSLQQLTVGHPSHQSLKRFSITTQIDQLLLFLQADCDAVLVVEEFNLQDDGWWDNLLDIQAVDKTFFHKGTTYDLSRHFKGVLLIGNSSTQDGRVSTVIESFSFLVNARAADLQKLVNKAIPDRIPGYLSRREALMTWCNLFSTNPASGYALTLRDLEAVVFESLHMDITIPAAGMRLLGYYCGELLAVQTGILERINGFLKHVQVGSQADLYLQTVPQARKRGLFFVGESGVGKTTLCMQAIQELRPSGFLVMSQSDAELWKDVEIVLQNTNPDLRQQLEHEMQHFSQHQLRDKAVLVAAKCGLVLYIDEFNTDRNLRLEETLNQVMSSGSGGQVDPNFFVIATGNPSRFHGRLELPLSLQTRFTTVLLKPIDPSELKVIIQSKQDFQLGDEDAQLWVSAFFAAKERVPAVTTRALLAVLRQMSV